MTTEIQIWKINDETNTIERLADKTMSGEGRKEPQNLEKWIRSDPSILGDDIVIIGEQTISRDSGISDLIGIDSDGNIVVIELKREQLERDALAQAIDYASDMENWDKEKVEEIFDNYKKRNEISFSGNPQITLDEYLIKEELYSEDDEEDFDFPAGQRILLVGTGIDDRLIRMIRWLSENYDVPINAIVLKYIKTDNGDELLARTMILSDEVVEEKIRKLKGKRHIINLSNEPGTYGDDELKNRWKKYLSENRVVPNSIRKALLPLCLEKEKVDREDVIAKIMELRGEKEDRKARKNMTAISKELGIKNRDYLRQIIQYDPSGPWGKNKYEINKKYEGMIRELLQEYQNK